MYEAIANIFAGERTELSNLKPKAISHCKAPSSIIAQAEQTENQRMGTPLLRFYSGPSIFNGACGN